LWVVLAAQGERIIEWESADCYTIDDPLNGAGGPLNGIGVKCLDWGGNVLVDSSVEGRGVALAEKVALDRRIGRAQPFPVNLIQIV
jgi:hypothetical protein